MQWRQSSLGPVVDEAIPTVKTERSHKSLSSPSAQLCVGLYAQLLILKNSQRLNDQKDLI